MATIGETLMLEKATGKRVTKHQAGDRILYQYIYHDTRANYKRSGYIYGPVNELRQAIFTALSLLVFSRSKLEPQFVCKLCHRQCDQIQQNFYFW